MIQWCGGRGDGDQNTKNERSDWRRYPLRKFVAHRSTSSVLRVFFFCECAQCLGCLKDIVRHHRVMREKLGHCSMFLQCMLFFFLSKRSGSSDTCAAGVATQSADDLATGEAFFCLQLLPKRGATSPSSVNTKNISVPVTIGMRSAEQGRWGEKDDDQSVLPE